MFTALKTLALVSAVGGSAAYATHAVTQKIDQTQPQSQDQQADPQQTGDQGANDQQNGPQGGRPEGYRGHGDLAERLGSTLLHLIDRRVDHQVDKRLAERFPSQQGGQFGIQYGGQPQRCEHPILSHDNGFRSHRHF